jgi:hypothetical protein
MAKVTIEFETDNAAFQDGRYEQECRYVIDVARRYVSASRSFPVDFHLRDSNGNTVGRVTVTE